jgi:hypothetical protein
VSQYLPLVVSMLVLLDRCRDLKNAGKSQSIHLVVMIYRSCRDLQNVSKYQSIQKSSSQSIHTVFLMVVTMGRGRYMLMRLPESRSKVKSHME